MNVSLKFSLLLLLLSATVVLGKKQVEEIGESEDDKLVEKEPRRVKSPWGKVNGDGSVRTPWGSTEGGGVHTIWDDLYRESRQVSTPWGTGGGRGGVSTPWGTGGGYGGVSTPWGTTPGREARSPHRTPGIFQGEQREARQVSTPWGTGGGYGGVSTPWGTTPGRVARSPRSGCVNLNRCI